ncbi:ABC transporter permease [Desulforamulus ruminis]|uniref:Inner-membrane translocator n=1 Tax=Desulforamulus ruminis (strain ATCC 23193 / DSM 2154 / NCIMB 8452 / DL) TaxID=696281 RepID=F6DQM5_DESRL|nr:ribose ABC transporter permease [Desulforamulus ruminis]AEG62022.1 inner-membrane translocator [Desulforamulus ruminis DSM 2154]
MTNLSNSTELKNNAWKEAGIHFLKTYGGILAGLIVLVVLFSFSSPHFFKVGNLLNIVLQISIIAICAFGMTFALIVGGIDLSVSSTIALSGTAAALLLQSNVPFILVVLMVVGLGVVLGAFNGVLISKASIPAFIVTVATMGIFRGIAYILTDGVPVSIQNPTFLALGNGSFLGIQIPIIILLVFFVFNHILLSKTKFGRRVYITGGNEEAALYAGINVARLKIWVYIITASMAAISGLIFASRLYSAQPNAASGYELDAIAAAVLGGTSLSGGSGKIFGTLIGAIIIGVINNGMNLMDVSYFYQLIVKGLVILIAVYIDVKNKSRKS